MDNAQVQGPGWSDVLVVEGAEPVVSYRAGLAVYEESLSAGRFVGRGWNGSGFVSFYDGRIDPGPEPTPQAFWLEIDGQLLDTDWGWGGIEVLEDDQPIPAMPRPFVKHAIVTLRHRVRPVTVKVHTGLDGTQILTRWLEVTNTGSQVAVISAAFTWSGTLQRTQRWQDHLRPGQALYTLGYMATTHWGNEGSFEWFDLPDARYCVDARYRRDRHRHPMFVLRNNATGEHFIGQLAWSGGYTFEFDSVTQPMSTDSAAAMRFRAGMDGPAPQRTLAPGETVAVPEMHLGVVFGDLDTAIQTMHEHVRRSVLMQQPRGRGGWIESGIGPEIEITNDEVLHAIDCAAEFGAEIFFIDASWYAAPGGNWWTTVGDWKENLDRFPGGLKPFRDRVHEKGMLWGLWMDAERVGDDSRLAQEHPEWLIKDCLGNRIGNMLDLTNPEVAQWMEDQIAAVITTYELDFFRLDYNCHGTGRVEHDGIAQNHYWRYYDAQYAVYDRLRARFPNVVFENCAGGGGRSDLGMVRRFSHTWVTDWQIAPRSFMITNGMTMALPPEHVDRLVGGQSGYTRAEFDFQMRLLLFVRSTLGFVKPMGSQFNPVLMDRMRHHLSLYKDFVRPFMPTGRIYHHTPVAAPPEPQGWGVLELASGDGAQAICGLFQLSAPAEPEYLLRLRGLDESRRYRVTSDNSGRTWEAEGSALMRQGIVVRLEGALTSDLLTFDAL